MKAAFLWLGALLLIAGCGRVNPEPSFRDSAARVRSATGADIQWARSREETETLERQVRELLQAPLSSHSAVQIALWNNRSLQAGFEELAITQADAVRAGLPENPEFGLSLRFPDRPPSASNLEIGLAQNLLDFLVLPARKKMALVELEQAKLEIAHKCLDLVLEVKEVFYTLQADVQLVNRLEIVLEINEAAAELARRQFEAGTMNELDISNHIAAYSQSKVDVALARAEVRRGRERLNRLLGLWREDTNWTLVETLPALPESEISLEGLEALALRRRPELQISRLAVDLVGRALALKKGTRWFPVGIHVGVDSEREPDRAVVTGPTLALQLPIFNWGRTDLARLHAQQLQAQRNLEGLAVQVRSEVRQWRDLLLAHREVTEFYRDVLLPQRIEVLDLTLRHYNMMLKGTYDLLLAKQNEVAAERAYIETWRDYWLAHARLERVLATTLPEQAAGETASPAARTRN